MSNEKDDNVILEETLIELQKLQRQEDEIRNKKIEVTKIHDEAQTRLQLFYRLGRLSQAERDVVIKANTLNAGTKAN
jgi:hypothetical protein